MRTVSNRASSKKPVLSKLDPLVEIPVKLAIC